MGEKKTAFSALDGTPGEGGNATHARTRSAGRNSGSRAPQKPTAHTHTHTVLTSAFITARLPSTCYPVFRGVYLQWCRVQTLKLRETRHFFKPHILAGQQHSARLRLRFAFCRSRSSTSWPGAHIRSPDGAAQHEGQ